MLHVYFAIYPALSGKLFHATPASYAIEAHLGLGCGMRLSNGFLGYLKLLAWVHPPGQCTQGVEHPPVTALRRQTPPCQCTKASDGPLVSALKASENPPTRPHNNAGIKPILYPTRHPLVEALRHQMAPLAVHSKRQATPPLVNTLKASNNPLVNALEASDTPLVNALKASDTRLINAFTASDTPLLSHTLLQSERRWSSCSDIFSHCPRFVYANIALSQS